LGVESLVGKPIQIYLTYSFKKNKKELLELLEKKKIIDKI